MAYTLSGQSWLSQPISWDFAGFTLASDQSTPFSRVITEPYAQAVVASAFEAWSRVAGLRFVYAPQDNAAVDIRIGWDTLTPPRSTASGTTTELGETDYRYLTAQNSIQPDVRIRLLDPTSTALSDATGVPTYTSYGVTLYQIALHEIGHAIGLAHDNDDPNAIMYPYASSENRVLAAPDIAGAQAIYGTPPADVVDIGANQETLSGSLSGAPTTVFGASGALDFAGGNGLIVLGSGLAGVQEGIVTVFAGSGGLVAGNNVSGEFILGSGAASISGGNAGSHDIVFGGSTAFTYAGLSEAATVVGGSGSDTITGGAGGGFYSGGTDGNNRLTATGIGTVLVGGGSGDMLRAAGAGYSYLVAGGGNETLVGAGGGTDRFFLGTGPDQVNLGPGPSLLATGAGTATILGDGSSSLFGGTGGADRYVEQPGSTMSISGFRQGVDHVGGAAVSSISVSGSNTVLRFADGAIVTLNGVADPSGSGLLS